MVINLMVWVFQKVLSEFHFGSMVECYLPYRAAQGWDVTHRIEVESVRAE